MLPEASVKTWTGVLCFRFSGSAQNTGKLSSYVLKDITEYLFFTYNICLLIYLYMGTMCVVIYILYLLLQYCIDEFWRKNNDDTSNLNGISHRNIILFLPLLRIVDVIDVLFALHL